MSSNPVQRLLAALAAHGIGTASGGGVGVAFRFRCPAHGGERDSVQASIGDSGQVLLHCHSAGCSAEQIAAAVGLELRDLFPTPTPRTSAKNGRVKVSIDGREQTVHESPKAAELAAAYGIAQQARKGGWQFQRRPADRRFEYRNAAGELAFYIARWQTPGRPDGTTKEVRPIRPAAGGWIIRGLPSTVRRPIYNLPEILAADPALELFAVEGERAADSLRAVGIPSTASEGGAGKAAASDWSALRGRKVCVLPDYDSAGEEYASEVLQQLLKAGATVRVCRLRDDWPNLPPKGDSVEWLAERAGESVEQLLARLQQLPDCSAEILALHSGSRKRAKAAGVREVAAPDDPEHEAPALPVVRFDFDERAAADSVICELGKRPDIFRTEGGLVQLLATDDGTRPHALNSASLRELISSAVVLVDKTQGAQTRPPKWLTDAIAARPDWPGVRRLRGIRNSPAPRSDGTLISSPGYDQASGLFCEFSALDWPEIPEAPSRADAVAALEQLAAVVTDFPFASPADRAGWLAAVLTVTGRQLIAGPCPGILFDASIRGAGKSMLCDVLGVITTGSAPPRSSWSVGDESEARKRLSSILFAPQPPAICLFDNIGGRLRSDALEAVLTAEHWEDRVLGASVVKRVPIGTTFLFSGNNTQLSSDLSRRLLRVRLEPADETPEERGGFRYPDLKGHVQAHRQELLTCALIALAAYVREGCPGSGELTPWGSFEHWSTIVRGCLVWAGQSDPATTRRALREESDSDGEALAVFVGMLREVDPWQHGLTTDQLIGFASGQGDPTEADLVRAALETIAGKPLIQLSSRTIGNVLAKFRGRPMAGFRLERRKSNGKAIWNLRPVSASFAEDSDSVTQVTLSPATHGNENSEFTFT